MKYIFALLMAGVMTIPALATEQAPSKMPDVSPPGPVCESPLPQVIAQVSQIPGVSLQGTTPATMEDMKQWFIQTGVLFYSFDNITTLMGIDPKTKAQVMILIFAKGDCALGLQMLQQPSA